MKGGELKHARNLANWDLCRGTRTGDVAEGFIELLTHLKRLTRLVTTEHGPEFTADVRALIKRAEGRKVSSGNISSIPEWIARANRKSQQRVKKAFERHEIERSEGR
jgi:hypothetical protein